MTFRDDSWRDSYDAWKLATPPEYEWGPGEEEAHEANQVRDQIDALMQEDETADRLLEICRLSKLVGDPSPISTSFDPKPIPDRRFDWSAVRADYDGGDAWCGGDVRGDPIGYGLTEKDAVADLLEWEDKLSSLNASEADEALINAIEDQGFLLLAIARRIGRATAYGHKPGAGTLRRIEVITRRLGQSAAAYRHARGM